MNTDEHRWNALTERIISCVYAVSNELGCGFFENVYENAMVVALKQAGLSVQQQVRFKVFYQGVEVGEYIADLVVEGTVLVELKAVKGLDEIHAAQCLNLLRTTDLPICLLVNFAKPKAEVKRYMGKAGI
jgi:GxxExxY protein